MNNPQDNFADFFSSKNHPALETFAPTPVQIIEALMMLCSQDPKWYEKPALRMMVSGGMAKVTDYIADEMEAGRRPDIHVGYAAFMMLLSDRIMTSREFASQEELENYPMYDEDE
jgi:hypothetical protein